MGALLAYRARGCAWVRVVGLVYARGFDRREEASVGGAVKHMAFRGA